MPYTYWYKGNRTRMLFLYGGLGLAILIVGPGWGYIPPIFRGIWAGICFGVNSVDHWKNLHDRAGLSALIVFFLLAFKVLPMIFLRSPIQKAPRPFKAKAKTVTAPASTSDSSPEEIAHRKEYNLAPD